MNLELIKKCGKIKSYKQNDFIVIEGDLGSTMYIIVKGKVGVYINSFVDEPFIVAELGVGNFFGEMSILDNMPRSATIICIEDDTTVLEIAKEHFDYLLENDKDLSYRIIKTLSDRIHNVIGKLPANKMDVLNKYKRDEVYKYISNYSKEIFEFILNQDAKKVVNMARHASEIIRDLEQKLLECEDNGRHTLMKALDVIPEGHKKYSYKIENNYSNLLLERTMKCPVCGHEFKISQPKFRSARILKIEKDLRKVCEPYSQEWYNIVTCPECLYSEYSNEFNNLSKIYVEEAKKVLNKVSVLKSEVDFKNLDINFIFIQYYLAMMCSINPRNRDLKMAKSWLNLSWLYKDVEDNEMYEYSYLKAYEIYNNIYLNAVANISEEDEQKMIMILAELSKRQGKNEEALKLFFNVTQIKNGNKQISLMAQDSIIEIKEGRQ